MIENDWDKRIIMDEDWNTEGKKKGKSYYRDWIDDNALDVEEFINVLFSEADYDDVYNFFYDEPKLAVLWITDYNKSNKEKLDYIVNQFTGRQSQIALVVGALGTGKTSFGFFLAEQIHIRDNRPIYYSGAEKEKFQDVLPKWIRVVDSVIDSPIGSFNLTDEAGLKCPARMNSNAMGMWYRSQFITMRQDDKAVLFMTQNTYINFIDAVRFESIRFHKKPAKNQADTERRTKRVQKFRDLLLRALMPVKPNECLYDSGGDKIMRFEYPLPSFWDHNIVSKAFKGYAKEQRHKDIESAKERAAEQERADVRQRELLELKAKVKGKTII